MGTFIRGLLFASGDAAGHSHIRSTSLDNSSTEIRWLDSFADIKLRTLTLRREQLSAASVTVKGAGNDAGESKHLSLQSEPSAGSRILTGPVGLQPGHTFPQRFDIFTARVLAEKIIMELQEL